MGRWRAVGWIWIGVLLVGVSFAAWPAKPFPESDINPLLTSSLQALGMQATGTMQPAANGDRQSVQGN